MIQPTVAPSERNFSPQTVCVPLSCLYLVRWYKPSVPATKEEAIALMAASGVTDWQTVGRFNFTKLAAGIKARYGLVGKVVEGAVAAKAAAAAAQAAGPCAIAFAGNQLNLTPHWQAGSIGHAIAVIYPPGVGSTGTQLDPLAPQDYAGDPFPTTEMAKFATAALIFSGAPEEDSVTTVTVSKYLANRRWNIAPNSTVVGLMPGAPNKVFKTGATGSGADALGKAIVQPLPAGYPTDELRMVANGALAGYLIRAATPGLTWAPEPVDPAIETLKGQLAAETLRTTAAMNRIATIKKKVASSAADIADD